MRSTRTSTERCAYLGVDITDRYSDTPRVMDVCGLEISRDKVIPHFWAWSWGTSGSIDVTALLPEITPASAVLLDGPQGLARVGCRIRSSERALASAGKTADIRPPLTQPYGGFIGSSLDLFAAFHAVGFTISSTSPTGLREVYPAAIWTRLARRLPNKRRSGGRQARVAILKALGVALPDAEFSHDELDACAAALLGAAADGRIEGVEVATVGDAVFWDETTTCLREGQILVPQVDSGLRAKLDTVVRPWQLAPGAESPKIARPSAPAETKLLENGRTVSRPVLTGTTREERAGELFDRLVLELVEGRPTICTYKAAVAVVLGYPKYTPAYGSQLTKLATRTAIFEVDGLGEIRLDTFLVNQGRRPGDRHWVCATYSEGDWERAFSGALVIE